MERERVAIPPKSQTHSGFFFDFAKIGDSMQKIPLYDLLWAIGGIQRFGAHGHDYTVLAHSILVHDLCPPELKLAGLVHDLHEGLVGDMQSPIKQLLPDYRELEDAVQNALLYRLGVTHEEIRAIKEYDLKALKIEVAAVLPVQPAETGPWAWLADVKVASKERDMFKGGRVRDRSELITDFLLHFADACEARPIVHSI